jgi:hypothetical protein
MTAETTDKSIEIRETLNNSSANASLLAMEAHDLAALQMACAYLEYPSLAARLSSVLGTPIETALTLLPR